MSRATYTLSPEIHTVFILRRESDMMRAIDTSFKDIKVEGFFTDLHGQFPNCF
jgi:hypothetical protein